MYKVVAFLMIVGLVACAAPGPKSVTEEDVKQLKGGSLQIVVHEPYSFALLSGSKGLMGGLGGLSMEAAGKKFIDANGVVDPAADIANSLASEIADLYDLTPHNSSIDATPNATVELHVKTGFWAFGTTLTSGDKWNVIYSPTIKLVQAGSGKIYASYRCPKKRQEAPGDPTLEQLAENDAAQLKVVLQELADECKAEFKKLTLGLEEK